MVMISERPAEAADRASARALGISMVLSSGGGELWRGCRVGPVVAQECPQDVHAAACEGDDGLVVGAGVLALFQVVVPAGSVPRHAGLRGKVEHAPQRAAVSAGLVQVPGPAAG